MVGWWGSFCCGHLPQGLVSTDRLAKIWTLELRCAFLRECVAGGQMVGVLCSCVLLYWSGQGSEMWVGVRNAR